MKRKPYSKYHAVKTGGCDSKHEHRIKQDLEVQEKLGTISNLKFQVPFVLIPKIGKFRETKYIADFTFYEKSGEFVVADAKGFRTEVYKIKVKLMRWVHHLEIREL